MRSNYQQGQSTVFGMVIPRLIRWRSRAMTQRSHAAWQEAARVARTPIIYTATEENCPLPTHGVTPCPNAAHMGEHACANKAQCWEPCGELGNDERYVRVGREDTAAINKAVGVTASDGSKP